MNQFRFVVLCIVGIWVVFSASVLTGQEVKSPGIAGAGPGMDSDGEPLPTGAKLRVGTRRFRHGGEAKFLAYSPSGKLLACWAEDDHTLRIFDAETGKVVRLIKPDLPEAFVCGLAFVNDQSLIAKGAQGSVVKLDIDSGKTTERYPVPKFEAGPWDPGPMAQSADGSLVAAAEGTSFWVLNLKSKAVVFQQSASDLVFSLRFSGDGERLVVASAGPISSKVRIWKIGEEKPETEYPTGQRNHVFVAVSPDNSTVAITAMREILMFDRETAKESRVLQGDDLKDYFCDLAFTNNGQWIVAGSARGQIYVWNAQTGERLWKLSGELGLLRCFSVRADGKRVAAGDTRNRVWIWDLESGNLLHHDQPEHDQIVQSAFFRSDGEKFFTGSGGLDAHLWTTASGKHQVSFPTAAFVAAASPDGKIIATTGSARDGVELWNAVSGERIKDITDTGTKGNKAVVFSQDSASLRLAVFEQPKRATVMRLGVADNSRTDEIKADGSYDGYSSACFAISVDERLAALAKRKNMVEIWNVEAGRKLFDIELNADAAIVAFTPDSRFLVSTSADKLIRVWELATAKEVCSLKGHDRRIGAMALSPSGVLAATGDGTRRGEAPVAAPFTIRLWNLLTGKQVGEFSGHDSGVASLAFSPDGSLLLSGLHDTTAIVWSIPLALRDLTPDLQNIPAEQQVAVWASLASPSAQEAQLAVRRLSGDSATAIALASKHLKPTGEPDAALVKDLIEKLDEDDFKIRTAAKERLAQFGAVVAPILSETAKNSDSAEQKQACRELLGLIDAPLVTVASDLLAMRAIQLLENMKTPEAINKLKEISGGAPSSKLTKEAIAALVRIKK